MKKCPYCAEEIQDDAIKCRYCFSDLRVDTETAMGQRPESGASPTAPIDPAAPSSVAPPAAAPSAVGAHGAAGGSVRYTHSGFRYVLGYGPDTFGIWDRQSPGAPAESFPRTDEGWRAAWIRFVGLEPGHVAVDVGTAQAPPAQASGPSAAAPEPGDDQALQFTHSGSTYLLGYGRTFFGIWQRSEPSTPIERFARDDDGWAAAWRRFTAIESNYVEVGLGNPGSAS